MATCRGGGAKLTRLRAAICALALGVSGCASGKPPGREFIDECERRLPPGRVQVRTAPVEPVVDKTLSYHELTRMAGEDAGYRWVLGLTRPALRVEAKWGFTSLQDRRTGQSCIRPALQMTLRYQPVLVYVGREFVEDACAFDFVYAHEMRHVDVHVRRLREVSLQLQSELQNRLAGSTHIGQRDDLERRLKAEIGNYWVPRAERDLKDVRRQHAAIDTPEEYARAQTACDGRVARYLPRLRQAVEAR